MIHTYKIHFLIFAFIAFFSLTFTSSVQGKHIIGGDMYYICNGNGSYTVTMKVYRDCSSDGAQYDSPGHFAVYNEANPSTPIQQLTANPTGILTIPPDNEPCFEISNPPCVQEASYSLTITLPSINNSYIISYQRCCRNNTINNISQPGNVGATYTVEISPEAQQVCNNSPVFNDFPPIVICAGQPIDFDHGATDSDADSLVYSFCSPLIGGGLDGSQGNPGNPNGPTGVQPIPPVGPPYNSVIFLAPTYASSLPMGGSPSVTIDSETGIISGVPNTLGQFVVGVCVREYRNGVFLGEIRRDFQFNVINCTPLVVADIESDTILNGQEFIINACGDFSVDFENNSFQESNIFEYEWFFDFNDGTSFNSDQREVTVDFPGLGTYEGYMALNPGTPCADTAIIFVNAFPDINADFESDYDICVAGPTSFTDLSSTGATGGLTSWTWNFGDGNSSSQQNPDHIYMVPGNLPVTLDIEDSNGCKESITKEIEYFPAPAILIVDPSEANGCAPQEVFLNNLSFPIDSTYTIEWDLGDGNSSSEISPLHIYETPGTYTLTLDVTSPLGCSVSEIFPDLVTIRPAPIAGFSYTPEVFTSFDMTATFTDESVDASAWLWNFGDPDGPPYLTPNPVYTFPDTGRYEVMQIVRHISGCLDTATAIIDVTPQVTYFLPNAFTPNNDGVNEEFKGVGFVEGMRNFSMTIWNRWGELVFETTDPSQGWNGRKNNQGDVLQDGVYVVITRYTEPRGKEVELKGFATLVK